jgi:acyl-CoA thioesterase FadM
MSRPINIDPERSSFGLRQAAWSLEQGRIVAECTSVQVMYDFKGLKKGSMTQEVREALEAIAGRCLQSTDA